MQASERDNTQDWLLPEGAAPPLLGELEERIDEALVIAKASEMAVMAVGDAALDAAQQARRAADIAERATAAVLDAPPPPAESPPPTGSAEPPVPPVPSAPKSVASIPPADTSLRGFTERADRVARRLRELERVPLSGAAGTAR